MKRFGESPPRGPARGRGAAKADDESYFDDDDNEDDGYGVNVPGTKDPDRGERAESPRHQPPDDASDDEEDPLDAFMAGISAETKRAPPPNTGSPPSRAAVFEDEDHMSGFAKRLKRKQAEQATLERETNEWSGSEGSTGAERDSAINYLAFEKDFFEPDESVLRMDSSEIEQTRTRLRMAVSGYAPPPPCLQWGAFGFGDILMRTITETGWKAPSDIQAQAISAGLAGRDVLAIAKTGSGKTAAFVLPLLVHCMDQPELQSGDGPIGLILAPTRELAIQIFGEAKKLAKCYGIRAAVLYGGVSKTEQFKELRRGCEILVSTPGRLIDLVKMKATNLRRVTYLVLDEADRMFDLGFEPQVTSICDNIRPDRQTLLFSATLPKRIENLARLALTDPIRIVVGNLGQANVDIHQHVYILESDQFKYSWLTTNLRSFVDMGALIIFVGRKEGVEALHQNLSAAGFDACAMHGDMMQGERDKVMREFKRGKVRILIATDIAARGLDIKEVKAVINYDIARDIDAHIHRIGRTGRAGLKGDAFTLVTRKENRFAGDLVRSFEMGGQAVPSDLLELALTNPKFRKQREFRTNFRQRHNRNDTSNKRRKGVGYK